MKFSILQKFNSTFDFVDDWPCERRRMAPDCWSSFNDDYRYISKQTYYLQVDPISTIQKSAFFTRHYIESRDSSRDLTYELKAFF